MKLSTCKRRCPAGELYTFKNGVAVVPGFEINRKPVTITLLEFNQLIQEIKNKKDQTDEY